VSTSANNEPYDPDDLIWGVPNIAHEIKRTPTQTYHLIASGALDGAIAKFGHKTIVASRSRLRDVIRKKKGATPAGHVSA
jgi:hypothetical protein